MPLQEAPTVQAERFWVFLKKEYGLEPLPHVAVPVALIMELTPWISCARMAMLLTPPPWHQAHVDVLPLMLLSVTVNAEPLPWP